MYDFKIQQHRGASSFKSAILRRQPLSVSRSGKFPKLLLDELLPCAVVLYAPPSSPREQPPPQRSAAPSLPWPGLARARRGPRVTRRTHAGTGTTGGRRPSFLPGGRGHQGTSDPETRAAVWKHDAAHRSGPRAATRGLSQHCGLVRAPSMLARGRSPPLPWKLPTH